MLFAILSRMERSVKSGRRDAARRDGLGGWFPFASGGAIAALRANQDFVKCARRSIALTSRRDLRREIAHESN
jgi:hypothetical protein